jgi:hypothetical protein
MSFREKSAPTTSVAPLTNDLWLANRFRIAALRATRDPVGMKWPRVPAEKKKAGTTNRPPRGAFDRLAFA